MGAVDDYLAGIEDARDRAALARVYEIARELVPDADQGIGYRMPALKHDGKVLISAIRAAKHLGVYPFSAGAVAAVAARVATIEGADSSTGAIRSPREPGSPTTSSATSSRTGSPRSTGADGPSPRHPVSR